MILNNLYFLLLGFLFGFIADLNTLVVNSLKNKVLKFIADFLMMCIFGVLYFTLLLALNDGIFRGVFFISAFVGFIIYMTTFFKLFKKPRDKISYNLKRLFLALKRQISKCAKISIKPNYFKKVLHSHK